MYATADIVEECRLLRSVIRRYCFTSEHAEALAALPLADDSLASEVQARSADMRLLQLS